MKVPQAFASAVESGRSETVALGLVALLTGWAASPRSAGVPLFVAFVLVAGGLWWLDRLGGTALLWLSLPVLGILGWGLGGLGPLAALAWPLSLLIAVTVAAFAHADHHRLWISVVILGLMALGIVSGGLPAWASLGVLAIPRLFQWRSRPCFHELWVEWAVATLSALFVGYWIRILIR